MNICYFGNYTSVSSRNQIVMKGLRANGVRVLECHSERPHILKYVDLIRKHQKLKGKYDVMIVGFPAFKAVVLAKLLTRKPVVFDPFISLYDTVVWDRQEASPRSLTALGYWLTDWLACTVADLVLLETNEQIDYFVKTFGLRRKKLRRALFGADDAFFYPTGQKTKRNHCLVHFHGSFIPVHGIQYILDAAKELKDENVHFRIVGSGQTRQQMVAYADELGLSNVIFIEKIPYKEINDYVNDSDITLGIFGDTAKATRAIPIKIYEQVAARMPVISGQSRALAEVFEDRVHLLTCRFADGKDLAAKIRELKENDQLRASVANEGYKRFCEMVTPEKIGAELIQDLREAFPRLS